MELNETQQQQLVSGLNILAELLSNLNNVKLTNEQVKQSLSDINQIADAELTDDYIKQVVELANNGCLTDKGFRAILHRIAYQQKLGNVKSIKGYVLNAIAKETNQWHYSKKPKAKKS